jgi:energy-coupling factor transporter ATP-binding protein EcfA2
MPRWRLDGTFFMHQVDRVEVDGFWETYHFKVEIHRDVTFFIGPNGTGKTTLINLIAAVLTGDFITLEKTPFKKITITLTSTEAAKSPTIVVTKARKKDRPVELIEYRIKKDSHASETRHSMEDFEDTMFRRGEVSRRYMADFYRRLSSGVTGTLSELVQVQWLSVNRATVVENPREERPFESSVDRKLESLSNELVRYFATFTAQKDIHVRQFQEYIFFSLLEQTDYKNLFADRENKQELVNSNEMTLAEIFRELHVNNLGTDKLIASFFDRARRAVTLELGSGGISIDDVGILFGLRKIEGVIEQWKILQDQLAQIFAQKDVFVKVASELLQRKTMDISDSNELVFTSRTGKKLTPQMLSSGEKQLLILLSEVLLQRQSPSIFIADEPELSLHVTWQEKLVSSLRKLNQHAQIIVATHSPDIVGALADRAIDMENVIP